MNTTSKSAFVACILMSTSVVAGETNNASRFEVSVQTDIQRAWQPETIYMLDDVAGSRAKTNETMTLAGVGVAIGYSLPEDTFLSNSFFGDRPSVQFSGKYMTGNSTSSHFDGGANANSNLNLDGSRGLQWANGTWASDNQIDVAQFSAFIKGSHEENTWSFAPSIGVLFTDYSQTYDLNSAFSSANRNVLDASLDADLYGLSFGGEIKSPSFSGYRISVMSNIKSYVADTDLSATQDKDQNINLFNTLSLQDDETSGVYEGELGVRVEKSFGAVDLSLGMKASAVYGMPYIHMPEALNDSARIENDETSYAVSGDIRLTVHF
ncbi:hypothetical protein [Sneathiella aquimaris]|uniref:hypothetical protein n=1 Tax=Sneathiella aquimaris TaxID=2599305 RepID=UPI00146D0B5A|nr:hypothetical protein [Sneathiella aquimaris]